MTILQTGQLCVNISTDALTPDLGVHLVVKFQNHNFLKKWVLYWSPGIRRLGVSSLCAVSKFRYLVHSKKKQEKMTKLSRNLVNTVNHKSKSYLTPQGLSFDILGCQV